MEQENKWLWRRPYLNKSATQTSLRITKIIVDNKLEKERLTAKSPSKRVIE